MKIRNILLLAAAILAGLGVLNLSAQTPQFQWAKRIASTTNPDDELAIGLAMDSQANAYVTGWFDGMNDFGGTTLVSAGGQDIFVAKYNNSGALQWARRAGCATADWDVGRGIGVDNAGNVYVTGGFHDTADFGSYNYTVNNDYGDFFLAKYNSAGVVQWVQQSEGGGHEAYGTGIAVDGSGNSYIVGYYDGGGVTFGTTTLNNPGDYNVFLVKYDSAGALQWAIPIASSGFVYSTKMVLDSGGNVCLGGAFTGSMTIGGSPLVSAGGKDLFIAKFSSAGALQWVRQAGGTGDDTAESGVAVDSANNVFISGAFGSTTIVFGGTTLTNAGNWDCYIAKYNSDGTVQWARRGGSVGLDYLADVATDQQGNAYAAGGVSTNASFGNFAVKGFGGWDVVVVKYDINGNVQWVQSAGGTNNDIGWKALVDPNGNIYVDGWFQGAAIFGTNSITGTGAWNFFLAKLAGTNNSPYVTTGKGEVITETSVTLNGTVNPNGLATTAQFEYGLTTAYGTAISVALSPNNDSTPQSVSTTLNGLQPGMTYHFRLTATNSDGTRTGSDSAFTVLLPYTYITNNGAITITGYTGSGGAETIPDTISGLPVTNIADQAFSYCNSLTSITIGNSVNSIGEGAFASCEGLTSITMSNNVITIGDWAFQDCINLTNVTIGNGVNSIGKGAFFDCLSLTGVTIGNSVTSIGDSAFEWCTNLTAIMVNEINSFYSSVDGVLFNKSTNTLIQCPEGKAGNYTVPNSVTSIGDSAFLLCNSLTGVTIGNSVTSIGNLAFDYCLSLLAITVDPFNAVYSSVNGGLFSKNTNTLIQCPGGIAGSYMIPNSVTSIASNAFYDCTSLSSVTVPSSVTSIGNYAFGGCLGLTGVYFVGNAPTDVGVNVFYSGVSGPPCCPGVGNETVYYRMGTTGWTATFAGVPTVAVNAGIPTLAITSPVNGQRWSNSVFTVTGIASDSVPVSSVWIQVNSNGWQLATTSNNWTNWTATASLIADTNVIQAYAVNAFNYSSTNASANLIYVAGAVVQVLTVGVHTNRFGFNVTGTSGQTVVVEACTNLINAVWSPVRTNTLTAGWVYFSDPDWTNYPARFYRLRSP